MSIPTWHTVRSEGVRNELDTVKYFHCVPSSMSSDVCYIDTTAICYVFINDSTLYNQHGTLDYFFPSIFSLNEFLAVDNQVYLHNPISILQDTE